MTESGPTLLRVREADGHTPVGYIELFFDLVYVFAITQLSHHLISHLTAIGVVETLVLFLAVWWAWVYTTWATNWLDPDRATNRIMLGMVMIGSMVMASALPAAFGRAGLVFACAYVVIQVGRTAFIARAMRRANPSNALNLTRATLWFVASSPFWIAGGLGDDARVRLALWGVALIVEYAGPVAQFVVPGLGRSSTRDWDISGAHMAERCALFIIIALGEGLLITGAAFGRIAPTGAAILAFLAAFVASFAMWWVYFDVGAKRGAEHIEHHDDPGRVARDAFTYWHIPIVAGVVVMAVADEMVLAHPIEPAQSAFVAILVTGGALFLGGTMMFKRISSASPWFPLSHLVGLALLPIVGVWGFAARPAQAALLLSATAVFIMVAVWEWLSFHGGWIERIEARGWAIAVPVRAWSNRIVAHRATKAAER